MYSNMRWEDEKNVLQYIEIAYGFNSGIQNAMKGFTKLIGIISEIFFRKISYISCKITKRRLYSQAMARLC